MQSEPFSFDSPQGYQLAARLEHPDGEPKAWALFAHCFSCGKDNVAAVRIARGLARHGIGTLRLDFAGLGASGGRFASTGFGADVDDLKAAGAAMAAQGRDLALMVGHSLGGAAVLAAAGDMPSVRAVVTIGAPSDVTHVLHQFDSDSLQRIAAEGEAEVELGRRPFLVRQSFIDELRNHDLLHRIATLHRPLLVVHAPGDNTVGIENAAAIYAAAKHPKSFLSLDGGDHLVTQREDAEFIASMIAPWAERYLFSGRARREG